MDINTNDLAIASTIKQVTIWWLKKTYKFLKVGDKVDGMAPPIWLLLRSLPNWGIESFLRFSWKWKHNYRTKNKKVYKRNATISIFHIWNHAMQDKVISS